MLDKLYNILKAKNYVINKDYSLIGVRNIPHKLDFYNDTFYFIFGGEIHKFDITTLTGAYYLKNPLNKKGCAILKEGQYVNSYSIGFHQQNKNHIALIQTGNVTVYRDINKDSNFDYVNPENGLFGINIHRGDIKGYKVGKWSAGCQVFKNKSDLLFVIDKLEKIRKVNNNRFTYTLINSNDLK